MNIADRDVDMALVNRFDVTSGVIMKYVIGVINIPALAPVIPDKRQDNIIPTIGSKMYSMNM